MNPALPAVLPENVWCPGCLTCFPVAKLYRTRQWVWDGWCPNCGADARNEYYRAATWAAAQAARLGVKVPVKVTATMDGFILGDVGPFDRTGTVPGDRFEAVAMQDGSMLLRRLPPRYCLGVYPEHSYALKTGY